MTWLTSHHPEYLVQYEAKASHSVKSRSQKIAGICSYTDGEGEQHLALYNKKMPGSWGLSGQPVKGPAEWEPKDVPAAASLCLPAACLAQEGEKCMHTFLS